VACGLANCGDDSVSVRRHLNSTIHHAFGYAYFITGEQTYKDMGDEVFDSSYVTGWTAFMGWPTQARQRLRHELSRFGSLPRLAPSLSQQKYARIVPAGTHAKSDHHDATRTADARVEAPIFLDNGDKTTCEITQASSEKYILPATLHSS